MPGDMARRCPARRLLLIFAATILTPGVILAGFGLRALTQERQRAESQVRDTLHVYSFAATKGSAKNPHAQTTPSLGAGGVFSSNGTFKGPSMACPPGGTF